tara:strand:+ start:1249 stop:2118 length:870 start_codon:yes stop_codon:yes gene_type:complete
MLHAIINKDVPRYFRADDFAFHESKAEPTASLLVKAGFATNGEVEEALSALIEYRLIEAVDDPNTSQDYFLSDKPWDGYKNNLPNGPTLFDRYEARGPILLQEALTKIHRETSPHEIPDEPEGIPADGVDLPLGGMLGLGAPLQSSTVSFSTSDRHAPEPVRLSESDTFPSSGGAVQQDTLDSYRIPATNRYVSKYDNQEIKEIAEDVANLISAIKEDRTNDFDDREGRLADLLALDFMLKQDQISVPLVETLMRQTVQYLAKRFVDVAIGQIATHILKLAVNAFGIQL